jgi:hypothetical protein
MRKRVFGTAILPEARSPTNSQTGLSFGLFGEPTILTLFHYLRLLYSLRIHHLYFSD